MFHTERTTSSNADFQALVGKLDRDLAQRDGEEHAFYAQFNRIDSLQHAVVVYLAGIPAGCGAMKAFDNETMEIKRMFTDPKFRKRGVARRVLEELETWAAELAFAKCTLETGINQPEAISLYESCGYKRITNYGQYAGVEGSRCFEKTIK